MSQETRRAGDKANALPIGEPEARLLRTLCSDDLPKDATLSEARRFNTLCEDRDKARATIAELNQIKDLQHRRPRVLGYQLIAIGDSLQLNKPGNLVKAAAIVAVSALAIDTALEATITYSAMQQLSEGFGAMVNAIPQVTEHGVRAIVEAIGTGIAIAIRPVERFGQLIHGVGKVAKATGEFINRRLNTQTLINMQLNKRE